MMPLNRELRNFNGCVVSLSSFCRIVEANINSRITDMQLESLDFGKNLIYWLKKLSVSQSELARRMGRKSQQVNALTKRKKVDIDTIRLVADSLKLTTEQFINVNPKVTEPDSSSSVEVPTVEIISGAGESIKLMGRPIPFFDVDVTAGNVAVFTNGLTVPTAYIFAPAFEGCIAIPLKGRSMINAYFPGDILFIEEVSHWRDWLEWGEVYVVVTPEQNLVKRVDPSTKKQHWRMVSFNPDNAPFDLPVRYVMQVFQVRGKIEQRSYVAAERIVAREVINEVLNRK